MKARLRKWLYWLFGIQEPKLDIQAAVDLLLKENILRKCGFCNIIFLHSQTDFTLTVNDQILMACCQAHVFGLESIYNNQLSTTIIKDER